MGAMASQIITRTIGYSTVYSGAGKKNINAPHHWLLCGEFIGDRWIPRTNGQLRGRCFHLMTSSWLFCSPAHRQIVVRGYSTRHHYPLRGQCHCQFISDIQALLFSKPHQHCTILISSVQVTYTFSGRFRHVTIITIYNHVFRCHTY